MCHWVNMEDRSFYSHCILLCGQSMYVCCSTCLIWLSFWSLFLIGGLVREFMHSSWVLILYKSIRYYFKMSINPIDTILVQRSHKLRISMIYWTAMTHITEIHIFCCRYLIMYIFIQLLKRAFFYSIFRSGFALINPAVTTITWVKK